MSENDTKPKTGVTVYPATDGVFLDGIPAQVQTVPETDAKWMCHSGAFIREIPAGYRVAADGLHLERTKD